MRLRPSVLLAFAAFTSAGVRPVFAATEATPSMAAESSKIRPAGERQLGTRERPTIKRKAADKAKTHRDLRVSLQIPERLREALAKKIDRRITRNTAETRKLRAEALGLLTKFIAESKDDSP